ncbi:WXG100 family type VII secretion target [Protofrankia coriariae]|uniref:Type VII secretion protein n=1 Tax=Protofrankia coriariae TaxID=1562887 RepID=A0ABR5F297_9ACTN|nr:WXG100 family type VII secretion target [Protofrankia coriariae]KLL10826.1 type VII secretion protein [Protofrankia coriariae]
MPNLNVTYQEMDDASGRLRNGRVDIEAQLVVLKKMVDALVAGGYVTDQSSVQFQGFYDRFNTGVTSTLAGLDGMADYLKKAADVFRTADAQLASSLRGQD